MNTGKKYKVYQVQRENIIVTHDPETENDNCTYDVKLNVIAEYITRNDNYENILDLAEDIWDACNVECWDSSWKPGEAVYKYHTITFPVIDKFKGFCNSDVIIETEDGLYRAESFGFTKVPTLEEGLYRIIYTYSFINWKDIRNKNEFSKSKLDEVIKLVREERNKK